MDFKIRASAVHEIVSGEIGLTEAQSRTYSELTAKEKRTVKQQETLEALQWKLDNPELPQGAKTYVKKYAKQMLYGRTRQINNKYINKGLEAEEDAFTLMAIVLDLGMVLKNEERKANEWSTGECDLFHSDIIYDNKCSFSLDTFPMFEYELPDVKYDWQMQTYMWLWNANIAKVVYTLIDCPESVLAREIKWIDDENERQQVALTLCYTLDYFLYIKSNYFPNADTIEFVEIPKDKRVKVFEVQRDEKKINTIKKRVELCRDYLNKLLV